MGDINKAVEWALNIANDPAHGYDQEHRNGPNYDCSSFVSTALNLAGFKISPYSWTGNMVPQLLADGWVKKDINAPREKGDIFIHTGHHVIMCVDSTRIVQASINEKGTITGGKSGDQTGSEIYVCNFYTPGYGWEYHLSAPHASYEDNPSRDTFTIVW